VTFKIRGELGATEGCHCVECRKWTGHFLMSTDVTLADLTIDGEERVSWHHSSEKARRGFCSVCGSSLFFDPLDKEKHDWIGVSAGAFDSPTGIRPELHIFVAEKGDYYEINDGLPQNEY
jgi:hypothetical protein